jgi:hypothetical protein
LGDGCENPRYGAKKWRAGGRALLVSQKRGGQKWSNIRKRQSFFIRCGSAAVGGKLAMVSHIGTTIGCLITQGAIDVPAKLGSSAPIGPAFINRSWQIEIETIASNKYNSGLLVAGRMIVVRPQDLIRARIIP